MLVFQKCFRQVSFRNDALTDKSWKQNPKRETSIFSGSKIQQELAFEEIKFRWDTNSVTKRMNGYGEDSDSGNTWTLVESKHSHRNTLSLGNYRGRPFVTGCDDQSRGCFTKTEIMDSGFRRFYDGPDYPFDFDSRSVKTTFTREL